MMIIVGRFGKGSESIRFIMVHLFSQIGIIGGFRGKLMMAMDHFEMDDPMLF